MRPKGQIVVRAHTVSTRAPAHRAETRREHRLRVRKNSKRRKVVLWSLLGVLVPLLAIAGWLGVRGYIAYGALTEAQAQVGTVQGTLTTGDGSVSDIYDDLHDNTALAVSMTSDPLWALAGAIPGIGANFSAVAATAVVVNDVVVNGVGPLAAIPDLSIKSLKPQNGTIDIGTVTALVPAVAEATGGLNAAADKARLIDASGALGPVKDAVLKVQTLLTKATALTDIVDDVVPLLPGALGADGPRNYLLLFQNNAEERALGGNPAALALITLDQGHIDLAMQASSQEFTAYIPPAIDLGPELRNIYTDLPATWVQNVSMVPDFPTVSAIATAMWGTVFPQHIDAVVSIDPVALSYLLDVTGPVALSTGDQLTGPTAVQFLLSDVYAKYSDPEQQDAVFAAAAQGAFNALSNGQGSMTGYFSAAQRMIENERLYIWSSRSEEQAEIAKWPLSGILPTSNDAESVVGVYFNDASSAKMSYYLEADIAVASVRCAPESPLSIASSVTLTNPVTAEQAQLLPEYVTGTSSNNGLPRGWIREDVIFYGPVGGSLARFMVDGVDAPAKIVGTDKGRPVALYTFLIGTAETHSVAVAWSSTESPTDTVALRTTPRVQPTPVTTGPLACP